MPRLRQAKGSLLAVATVSIVSTALVAAACSPPGSGGGGGNTTGKPKASVAKNPAKAGKVTLNVWDQEVRGGQNAEVTKLNKEFMAKYPNVTINRTSKSFSDLKTTLRLALSGKKPPDVVEANQGYPDMVTFVKAGQLVPLDKYAKLYGWTQRYPKTLLDLNRVSSDYKHFGEGKLYGISQMGEYITMYYNKSKLSSLGLTPPKTWSQFTNQLAQIKAKGQTPIEFGNLDKWPAILVYGTGNASWTDPKTVAAAKTLQAWATKGYLTKGANGLSYDDAAKKFASGTGVYLITGTWEAVVLKGPMGKNLGLMLPPPSTAGAPPVTTGGESLAWAITSKSKNPDVAAAYLNFMTNAHADDVMTQTGNLPAVPGTAAGSLDPQSAEGQMVSGWKKVSSVDGLVPYLDYSTPTFYDTLTAALQDLIGGQATPQKFTQTLQADYQKFHQQQ
jgi:raffinose/stachyose/melibiose transport system substrate-binding protein